MKWFLNLSTRAKLFMSFGVMIVLIATVIFTAYAAITAMLASQKNLYSLDFTTAVDLKDIRSNQNAERANLLAMTLVANRSDRDKLVKDIEARSKENSERLARLVERGRSDPDLLSNLKEFEAIRTPFRQTLESRIIPLIYDGKIEEAKKLALGVQAEQSEKMRTIADRLIDLADKRAKAAVTESEQRATESLRIFMVVGIITILTAAAIAVFLNRLIANPLKEIAGIAERVGAGDLTVPIASNNRSDEVGALAQTFRRMVENLREVTREVRDGINVLSSSASEIMAATTQVASGAAETATAISETTTTVEEVKQTAQVSSQKAKYMSETAQKSAQVSQTGTKSVEETIAAMRRIKEQMESVAESIVKLSEHSQAIGEIIATVNDLADQSNLLAVNAAIEAAKAGEQGKGFAVVAQEVRGLAEQSKQATAQVRAILTDIQKATSAAVMATEQGTKAVEAGVKQSADAGQAIRTLGDSITESAQAATQIAASSQQQMVGTDQVALAMENIKQASTQNVAGTKQAETAAQNLHDLGQKLKQLVEKYKVWRSYGQKGQRLS